MVVKLVVNGWVRIIGPTDDPPLTEAINWTEGFPLPAKGCRICDSPIDLDQMVAFHNEAYDHLYQCPACDRYETYRKATILRVRK